ncbi:MAG: hypothetical protein R3F23_08090 [Verrucomicrobiia bacterium]
MRLNIYPDGGVARFRVYGEVISDLSQKKIEVLDLARTRKWWHCNSLQRHVF